MVLNQGSRIYILSLASKNVIKFSDITLDFLEEYDTFIANNIN